MTTLESPMRQCPRYQSCSVNHCPLDPEQDLHLAHSDDRERKCPMEKGVRQRIGQKYPDLLPLLGLTPKEAIGAKQWANCSASEKEAKRERARQARALLPKQNKQD